MLVLESLLLAAGTQVYAMGSRVLGVQMSSASLEANVILRMGVACL